MRYQSKPGLIEEILAKSSVIAIVGISERTERASYHVAEYLSEFYTVIPVNPKLRTWLGLRCFPSLLDLPDDLKVDLIDIFRREEEILPVVQQVIERNSKIASELRTPYVWIQLGLEPQDAKALAERNGLQVVMDACLQVEHAKRSSTSD